MFTSTRINIPSLFAVIFFLVVNSAVAEIVTIANGNDFKPFTDEQLKKGGMITHIVEEAFKTSGWEVSYFWLPWKRGYELARLSKIDAAIPWTKRADTTNAFAYSKPIIIMLDQVWTRQSSHIKKNSDLKSQQGCLPIGYTIPEDRKASHKNGEYTLIKAPDMTTCFKLLANNRVDFVFCNSVQAASIIKSLKEKDSFRAALTSHGSTELYVVVSKEHPRKTQIINAFNSGLSALQASGAYEKIVASH